MVIFIIYIEPKRELLPEIILKVLLVLLKKIVNLIK